MDLTCEATINIWIWEVGMGPEAHSCSSWSPPPPHRLTLFGIPRPSSAVGHTLLALAHFIRGFGHGAQHPMATASWSYVVHNSERESQASAIPGCNPGSRRSIGLVSWELGGCMRTGINQNFDMPIVSREKRSEQITSQEAMLGVMVYDTISPNQQMAGVMVWENKNIIFL
ncbi:hypothetical protein BDW67DRAFT_66204 [Aspergillus spinulosporus]